MIKKSAIIFVAVAFIPYVTAFGQNSHLRECIDTLSSPTMKGRGRINTGVYGDILPNTGHDASAKYIASSFAQMGLIPFEGADFECRFPMPDGHGDGINVMGLLPGLDTFDVTGYIVVGAHYDHLGTIKGIRYPGADSNASGVAALLAVADHFHLLRQNHRYFNYSIIFVSFDCYLDRVSGAKRLWNQICSGNLVDPKTGRAITADRIRLMVDLDQLGSSMSPIHENREDYLISIGISSLPKYKQNILFKANSDLMLDLGTSYYDSENFTKTFYSIGDRGVFVKQGIPTLYFTSGITDLTNTIKDTPERINFFVLDRRVDFICRVLEEFF